MSLLEYYLSATVLRLVYLVSMALPVRADKVVFASARAEKLEGNLAFIHDELLREHPHARVVLLLQRYSYDFSGKVAYFLKLIPATYHVATAHVVFVDNAYLPVHLMPHRRGTQVIQVWHAGGALKKFGMDESSPKREVEKRFFHKYYDYVIVGADVAVEPYASALRTPVDRVVPLGIARTDFFFDEAAMGAARARVLAAHPQLEGKTVVLYAPTFRGSSGEKRPYQGLDAALLRERLGDGCAIVHKTHPVFDRETIEPAGYDAVIDTEFDVNELFTVTDILVTDYSSSVFEYALMRKPLVLLVDDLDEYQRDPGFYLDFRTAMVGTFAESTEQVAEIVSAGQFDIGAYDAFIRTHCQYDDGHASARIVEYVWGK